MNTKKFEFKLKKGIFKTYLERPKFSFFELKQIHSNKVILESEKDSFEADGVIGFDITPQCILTADCLPIIIVGKKGHASLHAGWKGIRDQIVLNKQISELIPYYAFIGPHICKNCYEIQADFQSHFPGSQSIVYRENKLFFDLFNEISIQLKANYPNIEIEHAAICTMENDRLYSYRKNKTKLRNYNLYFPNGVLK
jgi:copper oxidase (laccase) domain-containing protein